MKKKETGERVFANFARNAVQRFRNRSIRFKLLLYFVIIILVSIVTLGAVGTTLYKRSMEETANEHTIQMMGQVKHNIVHYFSEMENILDYITHQREVVSFYRMNGLDEAAQARNRAEVQGVIAMYENNHPEIAGILLVNEADQFVSNKLEKIVRDPLTSEAWYRETVRHSDELRLISKPIGRNLKTEYNYSADQVLSFVKAVKDPETGSVLGVALLDLELSVIQRTIESVSLGKSGFVYITDQQGGIVYSPVNPAVYRIHPDWLESGYINMVKTIHNRSYQIMQNRFEDIHWKIVGVFPLDESQSVVVKLQLYTVVVVLITLLMAVMISWFFTNSIINPVRKLRSLMKRVEEGEMQLRFHIRSKDEIGQLGHSFNKMVQEIERLIQLVYTEQKEKREAELKVLQEQIKPHFLYNTLDTIQWMAQDRKADDIVEMVGALTNLFRIGLSKGKETIRLAEELKHVESYLIIQMARYEGKLSCRIEADDELMDCTVLKLILQPLVENAIYHGIKMKKGKGMIRIEAVKREERLVLSVADDGVGIDAGALARINDGLKHAGNPEFKSGYGLFNVNERIRLTYGAAYGIEVESEYGQGTRINVSLPLLRDGNASVSME